MNSIINNSLLLAIAFRQIFCGEYFSIDGREYYVSYPDKRNWYQSLRYCTYNGMYLVDVRNDLENNRVLSIIEKLAKHKNVTGNFWTSGTDLGSEGSFYWATTGHQFLFGDWQLNQPDSDASQEHCVCYWGTKVHKWNDIKCELEAYFICRDQFDVPDYKNHECRLKFDAM